MKGTALSHHRRRSLPHAGQALLNLARRLFLALEFNLRVFLSHPHGAVAGDLRRFNARCSFGQIIHAARP